MNKKIAITLFAVSAMIYLLSIHPVNNILVKPLEYHNSDNDKISDADCMIVLGGGVEETILNKNKIYYLSRASLERIYRGFILWRENNIPVIVTGGAVMGTGRPEAEIMAENLMKLGVPENFIIKEPLSRNTKENALFTKKILLNHRFKNAILITSSSHMKRSLIYFDKLNVKTIPAASDYLTSDKNFSLWHFFPSTECFHISYNALHEYFGILYAMTLKV